MVGCDCQAENCAAELRQGGKTAVWDARFGRENGVFSAKFKSIGEMR